MTPHIDADVLLYEIGFGCETGWKATHPDSTDPPPFDYVAEMLNERIEHICHCIRMSFGACSKPKLYLTGSNNFRIDIAKKKEYKGTRNKPKPFHYNNIKGYLLTMYDCVIAEDVEADDLICIAVYNDKHSIACTRDKDLRQCAGWHFGWELGKQPQYGPKLVEELGEISLSADKKKIVGCGHKFFFSQMITGDSVDNIPGLPKNGPVEAYKLLSEAQEYADMEKAVVEAYRGFYGDSWKEEFMEQAYLLWMVRELDEEGKPVMFKWRGEYN